MGPYFLGMIAAYWVLNPSAAPARNSLLEVICVILIISMSWVGLDSAYFFPPTMSYIYRCAGRTVYGACWCYLVPGVLTKEETPKYRPAYCCKALLSWSFWLPLATVSYSVYIFHYVILMTFTPKPVEGEACPGGYNSMVGKFILAFAMNLAICFLLASVSFICIEKPFNDARTVFKSKHQLAKEKEQRLQELKNES